MSDTKQDRISYNGQDYDIPTGLGEDNVREAMVQIAASAQNADITQVSQDDGTIVWVFTERGGEKG